MGLYKRVYNQEILLSQDVQIGEGISEGVNASLFCLEKLKLRAESQRTCRTWILEEPIRHTRVQALRSFTFFFRVGSHKVNNRGWRWMCLTCLLFPQPNWAPEI